MQETVTFCFPVVLLSGALKFEFADNFLGPCRSSSDQRELLVLQEGFLNIILQYQSQY